MACFGVKFIIRRRIDQSPRAAVQPSTSDLLSNLHRCSYYSLTNNLVDRDRATFLALHPALLRACHSFGAD
jgi:hypothetical protein